MCFPAELGTVFTFISFRETSPGGHLFSLPGSGSDTAAAAAAEAGSRNSLNTLTSGTPRLNADPGY